MSHSYLKVLELMLMDLQMELNSDYVTVKARSCKRLEFEQQALWLKMRTEVRLNLRRN